MPAGTWVRRRDDLEAGREGERALGPRDRHATVLQRLAQRLEARPAELPELVEKEDAPMRDRDLPGPRWRPAADEPGRRDRVVGRAERSLGQGPVRWRPPGGAGDLRHLHGLGAAERRQQGGQPPRGQGLAGARRADDEQAVPARRRDLQRVAQARLAAQVGEIGERRRAESRPAAAARAQAPHRSRGRGGRRARGAGRPPAPPRVPPRPRSPPRRLHRHLRAARPPPPSRAPRGATGSTRRARAHPPATSPPTARAGSAPTRRGSLPRSRDRSPAPPCAGPPARGSP